MGYNCNSCDHSWLIDITNEEEVQKWHLTLEYCIRNLPSSPEELDRLPHTMNVYANHGDKILFYYPNNGLPMDKEKAKKFLKQGEIYTVDRTKVFSDFTIVFLIEIPDVPFNSVMFKDLDH